MMKKYLFLFLLTASLFLNFTAKGAPSPSVVEGEIELAMVIPDGDDSRRYSTIADASLSYTSLEGGVEIPASSIPKLVFSMDDPPEGFEALTIEITGTLGTSAKASWKEFPRVKLAGLSLHIRAFECLPEEIDRYAPFVEFSLPAMELSTEKISVNGYQARGFVDLKNMQIYLVGKTELPSMEDPDYSANLAGRAVVIELGAKLKKFGK
ncbi:MAG: hypothetical protein GX659_03970 [Myxococcales bacterium]|nr:hypothetical protein [Myxococcales bacterium]